MLKITVFYGKRIIFLIKLTLFGSSELYDILMYGINGLIEFFGIRITIKTYGCSKYAQQYSISKYFNTAFVYLVNVYFIIL